MSETNVKGNCLNLLKTLNSLKEVSYEELKELIKLSVNQDLYLTCQIIIYVVQLDYGIKANFHMASSIIAPHIAGLEYAKNFYKLVVHHPTDMQGIIKHFNNKPTNAMKKGFRDAIEEMTNYSLLRYKNELLEVINLVHPRPPISQEYIMVNGEEMYTLDAIKRGLNQDVGTEILSRSTNC